MRRYGRVNINNYSKRGTTKQGATDQCFMGTGLMAEPPLQNDSLLK